jgi:hypothetical protein
MKIAFLFLVISSIYHESHWLDFFKGHDAQYTIYVHAKETLPEYSPFKQYEIQEKTDSTWLNSMNAQVTLLRWALEDPENEIFIFVSESTIPFCDFSTIYDRVMTARKSIFPFVSNAIHLDPMRSGTFWGYHNYQPRRNMHPIPEELQYRTSQWTILNRKHAEVIVQDTEHLEIISKIICDNEHYTATILAIHGMLDEVENYQITYDDWIITSSPSSPFTFTDLQDTIQYKTLKRAINGTLYSPQKYFFGRKFAKDCDLTPIDALLTYRKE